MKMMIIMMDIEFFLSVGHCAAWFTDLISFNHRDNPEGFF